MYFPLDKPNRSPYILGMTKIFKRIERARVAVGLDVYEFSVRLGFSAMSYRQARHRGKLSHWMARAISQRYKIPLEELVDGK